MPGTGWHSFKSGLLCQPQPLPGIEVSGGGADGLLQEADTSVRNVAIVRLIADPANRAVYATHAAGGARLSTVAQTSAPVPAAAAVAPTNRLWQWTRACAGARR